MIDSSLFGVDIPAGTYAAGDMVQLNIVDGPANVRSGRGEAKLKRVTVGQIIDASGAVSTWKVYVKNSDWVDPMTSVTATLRDATALDERSGCVQRGHDCPLTPNSSWEVYAVCLGAATTTVANSVFALIDVDYPSVSSIVNPDGLIGIPASIEMESPAATPIKASGTLTSSAATTLNVDLFKAGYIYALEKLEIGGASFAGFVSISNAAGMSGLKRIIPVASVPQNIRNKIEYASQLVKGPMDVSFNLYSGTGTATTAQTTLILDFVKRRV